MLSSFNKIGDFYIYNVQSREEKKEETVKQKICNFALVDNSASMENYTSYSVENIFKGLLDFKGENVEMIPGELILFSHDVKVYPEIKSSEDLLRIKYPEQGSTNITAGVKRCIERILLHKENTKENIHYIMTFLSDGQHNCGPQLDKDDLSFMKNKINGHKLSLSVIVVGINSNDTILGMKVKDYLETCSIPDLDNVYYARDMYGMKSILDSLTTGIHQCFNSGKLSDITVEGGFFLETGDSKIRKLLSKNTIFAIKSLGEQEPIVYVNGERLNPTLETESKIEVIKDVISDLLPALSRAKIAYGVNSIKDRIKVLEDFILVSEELATKLKENDDRQSTESENQSCRIRSSERLRLLKESRKNKINLQEERNKLKLLLAETSNDSSKQASYLNGFNKKFASKAILKADTISVTVDDVLKELESIKDDLQKALSEDIRSKYCSELDDNLADRSALSLNSPLEQLDEWLSFDPKDFTDIYSLLVYFGFTCYPVKFCNNNAVQMDPFQTECVYIEPCMVDTNTIMLANQTDKKLKTQSRETFTDGLILLDPSTVNSFKILRKTYIYQYLCSITLCRDLYMYHPRMTFSMHAHALNETVNQFFATGSKSYLELALKIIYSFKQIGERNDKLLEHWWINWETITQSQEDNCSHPIQLILLLACSNHKCHTVYQTPWLNLLNEVLARKAKMIFSSFENPEKEAAKMMQTLLGIDRTNSPNPSLDLLQKEPSVESIRESCQHWAHITDTSILDKNFFTNSISEYINNSVLPYIRTFELAKLLLQHDDWQSAFLKLDERDKLLNFLFEKLVKIQDIFDIFIICGEKQKELVLLTMFLQSVLYHTSSSRKEINLKSVCDPLTLQEIIVDLRMKIYTDLCKVKMEKYLSVEGILTFEEAKNSNIIHFEEMLNGHTHRLHSDSYWAILKAAVHDPEKLEIFKKKTNYTFDKCLQKAIKDLQI